METYLVGIDGGGTKTVAKAVFLSGGAPVTITGGPLNLCSVTQEQAAATLHSLLAQIDLEMGEQAQCAGICIGSAGFSNPKTAPFLLACARKSSGCARVFVTSDVYIALCGALRAQSGIALIAGTGSICLGVDQAGGSWCAGGAGHLIGDEGSGYAIGRDILSAVFREMDGRGGKTILSALLASQKQLTSREEIIAFAYRDHADKSAIASLAPLLTEACEKRDRVALRIASAAARSLFELGRAVIERLSMQESNIALCGGVLQKDALIREELTALFARRFPALGLVVSAQQPVDGAVFLARQDGPDGFPLLCQGFPSR